VREEQKPAIKTTDEPTTPVEAGGSEA